MEFEGPSHADYDNIRSLNAAFLELMRNGRSAALAGARHQTGSAAQPRRAFGFANRRWVEKSGNETH